MAGKINLKLVRPEHSNRISCLLGTNRGKRDENTPLWTYQRDCVEGFFNPCRYVRMASPTSEGSLPSRRQHITVL